jgi:hypothetical protein
MYELLRLGSEVYFKQANKQKSMLVAKVDRLIKEQERHIVELKLLKDEIISGP